MSAGETPILGGGLVSVSACLTHATSFGSASAVCPATVTFSYPGGITSACRAGVASALGAIAGAAAGGAPTEGNVTSPAATARTLRPARIDRRMKVPST